MWPRHVDDWRWSKGYEAAPKVPFDKGSLPCHGQSQNFLQGDPGRIQ